MSTNGKRGGDRRHPKDCSCGKCPEIGRKKRTPEVDDPKFGKAFFTRVFARIKELGLKDAQGRAIESAEDYALQMLSANDAQAQSFFKLGLAYIMGKPVQPVISADTRETAPELDFGNLVMPAAPQPGAAGKPN